MNKIKMLHAIIVDDEKRGISALKLLTEKYIEEVKIIAECTRAVNAIELIESYKPDIVFLDINMPGMNGFEMLDRLEWKSFSLVFTTAHQEYALKALKNNAIDYLLKPISHKDLRFTIDKIKKQLFENKVTVQFNYIELFNLIQGTQKQRLLVSSGTDVASIDPDEIIFMESQSNYTRIFLANATEVTTRKTLKEFESQLCLPDSNFMRVHNSFIINLTKVSRYLKTSESIVMCGDQKIPVAKSRKESFYSWLNI